MGIILSKQQTEAKNKAVKWIKNPYKQVFVIAGYAGTGKTTIVNYIMEEMGMKGSAKYVAFTGKASLVLSKKGCNAETIHKLIYRLEEETTVKGKVKLVFRLKDSIPEFINIIVVDEVSMVPDDVMKDLLSFGIYVLALGDPGQLPPVGDDNGYLNNPDVFLDEIHRQAENDPIIYLSMLARTGQRIRVGKYGENVIVTDSSVMDADLLKNFDQIICGYNKTRTNLNNLMRQELDFTSNLPMIGDKLICLKNNWEEWLDGIPLINGTIGYVTKINDIDRKSMKMWVDFRPDYSETKAFRDLEVDLQTIIGIPQDSQQKIGGNRFDFGYAITCHKAQGSEFDRVAGFREMQHVMSAEDFRRWEYTLITRAVKFLLYGI